MPTIVTLDSAGRLVLPKAARDRLGLGPGSELELQDVAGEIRLRPVGNASPLRDVHGILVYTGVFTTSTTDAVQADRAARLRRVSGQ